MHFFLLVYYFLYLSFLYLAGDSTPKPPPVMGTSPSSPDGTQVPSVDGTLSLSPDGTFSPSFYSTPSLSPDNVPSFSTEGTPALSPDDTLQLSTDSLPLLDDIPPQASRARQRVERARRSTSSEGKLI